MTADELSDETSAEFAARVTIPTGLLLMRMKRNAADGKPTSVQPDEVDALFEFLRVLRAES